MTNYLDEQELNQVKGLMHYLNGNLTPGHGGLVANIVLTDSNGEAAGVVSYEGEPGPGYVLRMS